MEKTTTRSLPPSWLPKSKKKPNGTGRKKIEIKKIQKHSSRKVAFSKRRKGLFKKAGEICRLCASEIAIIVISPKGRLYTFGHPSPDRVIDKFLSENNDDKDRVMELTMEDKSLDLYEDEDGGEGFWWEKSIEDLNSEELERYKYSLEELRYNIVMKMEEIVMRRNCERDFLGLKEIKV